jgi:hypothetical protein
LVGPPTQPSSQPSTQPPKIPCSHPNVQPTSQPSWRPLVQPCSQPTIHPTLVLSSQPTNPPNPPSFRPSVQPTIHPAGQLFTVPSSQPTYYSMDQSSCHPSGPPTCLPSSQPSRQPAVHPTFRPSSRPSDQPTSQPSVQSSSQPAVQSLSLSSFQPSRMPPSQPTSLPSCHPSTQPLSRPSNSLTSFPSSHPSFQPSRGPSSLPSVRPSAQPIVFPSYQPSFYPGAFPSVLPSVVFTFPLSVVANNNIVGFKGSLFLFGIYISSTLKTVNNIYLNHPILSSAPSNYIVFGKNNTTEPFSDVIHLEAKSSSSAYAATSSSSSFSSSLISSTVLSRDSISRSSLIVGDINGDNAADLMIGYPYSSLCLIYLGKKGTAGGDERKNWSNMTVSFIFRGLNDGDGFGWAIDGLGDINGDGFDDTAVAAKNTGIVYILYGKPQFRKVLSMSSLTQADGYRIVGNDGSVNTGMAISNGRDFNGDGKREIVISSMIRSSSFCIIYVVSLSSDRGSSDVYLDTSDSRVLLRISGPPSYFTGLSLSGVGDINGDGYDDIAIGSVPYQGGPSSQKTYVIYGRSTATLTVTSSRNLLLSNLQPKDGFIINGGGFLVASPGDVNDDGIHDLLIVSYSDWHYSSNAYLLGYPRNVTFSPSLSPSSSPTTTLASSSLPSSSSTNIPHPLISFFPAATVVTSSSKSPVVLTNNPHVLPSFSSTKPKGKPSVSPFQIRSLSPIETPTSITPTKSPISAVLLPSSHPSASLLSPVSEMYEERQFAVEGHYDLSSTSSSFRQHIYIIGNGSFVFSNGIKEIIYYFQPNSEQQVEIIDYNSKIQKLDFTAFTSLSSIRDFSYSYQPLTLYPQGESSDNIEKNNRQWKTVSSSLKVLSELFSPSISVSSEDNSKTKHGITVQTIILSSHNSMKSIDEESLVFRHPFPSSSSHHSSSFSNPFNLTVILSLCMLLCCFGMAAAGKCHKHDSSEQRREIEKKLIKQSQMIQVRKDFVSSALPDIENYPQNSHHSSSASSSSSHHHSLIPDTLHSAKSKSGSFLENSSVHQHPSTVGKSFPSSSGGYSSDTSSAFSSASYHSSYPSVDRSSSFTSFHSLDLSSHCNQLLTKPSISSCTDDREMVENKALPLASMKQSQSYLTRKSLLSSLPPIGLSRFSLLLKRKSIIHHEKQLQVHRQSLIFSDLKRQNIKVNEQSKSDDDDDESKNSDFSNLIDDLSDNEWDELVEEFENESFEDV